MSPKVKERSSTRSAAAKKTTVSSSPFCQICGCTALENREGCPEQLVHCSICNISDHPSCLPLTPKAREKVRKYAWECQDCKRCIVCSQAGEELISCEECDRACHLQCAVSKSGKPAKLPWRCPMCKGKKIITRPPPQKKDQMTVDELDTPATPLAQSSIDKENSESNLEGEKTSARKRGRADTEAMPSGDEQVTAMSSEARPRVKLVLSNKDRRKRAKMHSEDAERLRTLPFGGRLTEADADSTICRPDPDARIRFEDASTAAEMKSHKHMPVEMQDLVRPTHDDDVFYAPTVPKINAIQIGRWEINTWYGAPYPEEYNGQPLIYICEYCFKYMKTPYVAGRHKAKCPLRHPPGDEIYRHENISVFEVDGRKNKIFCQNLCLLAKMFLDHKTLYYDVEPFLFYIMTENDSEGCHFVGYFSKEKRSSANYNLSCIVTLPISQRKGYGSLLIEFSYLLSRKEGRTGSPEKPLSDLGLLSYRRYWRRTILQALNDFQGTSISIDDLSRATCMTFDDIIHTLHLLHILLKNHKGEYILRYPKKLVEKYLASVRQRGFPTIHADKLRWTPLLFKSPALNTSIMPLATPADDSNDNPASEDSLSANPP